MSLRIAFDSLVSSVSGASARIGLFLAAQADDEKYALLPRSMFAGLNDHRLFCDGYVVGAWRPWAPHETSTELCRSCVLATFNRDVVCDLQVDGTLAGSACGMEEAFGRAVRIFAGSNRAVGKVSMAFRPISLAIPKESPVLLRDTLAVRFEALSDGDLKLGRLVVTEDDKRPLGIILGGGASYCLLAPIQTLLREARFRIALVEKATPTLINELRDKADQRLDGDTKDRRWLKPNPILKVA